ncbi:MAG: hypothetical protein IMX00_00040 [Limnochordales bacterium]|nr:hypothetical protein [Limnochordales bacterium]
MPQVPLTQFELQYLRELIGAEQLTAKKAQQYAQQATNPQLRDLLQQMAARSTQASQQLIAMLQ